MRLARARRGPAGDLGELRAAPAGLDQVADPDVPRRQAQRDLGVDRAGRGRGRPPRGARPWGRRCRRAGRPRRPSGARSRKPPQERVQLADGGLEVEPGRPIEAQARRVRRHRPSRRRRRSPRRPPSPGRRPRHPGRSASSPSSITSGARDGVGQPSLHERDAAARGARPGPAAVSPRRSRIRATAAVPPSTALRAIAASAAGVVRWACWRQ